MWSDTPVLGNNRFATFLWILEKGRNKKLYRDSQREGYGREGGRGRERDEMFIVIDLAYCL